jgi:iron complex outermembrane receptor protein
MPIRRPCTAQTGINRACTRRPLAGKLRPLTGIGSLVTSKVSEIAFAGSIMNPLMRTLIQIIILGLSGVAMLLAQAGGVVRGRVTLNGGKPVHNATVILLPLGRSTQTDLEGAYEFRGVAPGNYDVVAHLHPLSDDRRRVAVTTNGAVTQDFNLLLEPRHEHITVTASGREETALEAFQTVTSMSSLDLTARAAPSLGEVLQDEAGVTKRSFGPGSSRPVIRGFDGDRVLILQDGLPTGTLSYQSGDHGEPIDVTSLGRVEVVRGPATLLYGSNAIGGVVNAVTTHHQAHQHPHEGVRGHLTAMGGTNNAMGGGSGGFEFGKGRWLLWGGGGGQRTGDYHTPLGRIENSHTRFEQANGGVGYYGERFFGSIAYSVYEGKYGIPSAPEDEHEADEHDHEGEEDEHEGEEHEDEHEEEGGHGHGHEAVDLKFRRHNVRVSAGVKDLGGALDRFTVNVNYTDWNHNEVADGQVENRFFNKVLSYRGVFDQERRGMLSGNFGFMGQFRDYKAIGAEATTPPVTQQSFALFALEQLDLERVRFQFGGRMETTHYSPDGLSDRSFTGFSGAAGIQVPLWRGGSFVSNYTHSFRAPALEELYAFGPHVGNLTFEIGDANLRRERGDGLDLSLRHHSSRFQVDVTFFEYWLGSYVYLAPTGEIEDGLVQAEYRQTDAQYRGAEGRLDLGLHRNLWLNLGFDMVKAELRDSDTPLPRIPPLRGRAGVDFRYGGLSVRPMLRLADRQDDIFPTEETTAGYGVVQLDASYTLARSHVMHIFGVNAFNLGDNLYRNHLSFIKAFAPEIGRGVKFYYTVQFF